MNVFVWVMFVALWKRSEPHRRPALAACLVFATAGEAFLSLVWGLYTYRLDNIPLFVPPGHVLLFFLGTQIAEQLPDACEWMDRGARGAAHRRSSPGPGATRWGRCCTRSSSRACGSRPRGALYATMFVLVARAWSSTARGSATGCGRRACPGSGSRPDNPPLAAGAFYCVLDLLVVA